MCLDGQLVAPVLGARVDAHENGTTEAGYSWIDPTESGRDWFRHSRIFCQWHREGFGVPAGATLRATGDLFANQAFVYGENPLEMQFHSELTRNMIDR